MEFSMKIQRLQVHAAASNCQEHVSTVYVFMLKFFSPFRDQAKFEGRKG